jgi:hypothetical protein
MTMHHNTKFSIKLLLCKFNKQEDDIAREDTNILTLTRYTDIVILDINILPKLFRCENQYLIINILPYNPSIKLLCMEAWCGQLLNENEESVIRC